MKPMNYKELATINLEAFFASSQRLGVKFIKLNDDSEIHFRVSSKSDPSVKADIFITEYLKGPGNIDYVDINGSKPLDSVKPKDTNFTSFELNDLKNILKMALEI